MSADGTDAVPGPTFCPLSTMIGSPAANVPWASTTFSPETPLPLRCPETPAMRTTFLVAASANSSAPPCLSSMQSLSSRRSKRRSATTLPWAMTSSARSSPGTLLRNIILPFTGSDVPKASTRSFSTIPTVSPMHGRMSPGLLISNSRPLVPQREHTVPSRSVPQASHHMRVSFPFAGLMTGVAIYRCHSRPDKIDCGCARHRTPRLAHYIS